MELKFSLGNLPCTYSVQNGANQNKTKYMPDVKAAHQGEVQADCIRLHALHMLVGMRALA